MGEPDKDRGERESSESPEEGARAFAATELESGVGEASARRLPTPVLLRDEEEGPDPMLGRVLGGLYKVEERIGEGGMGTVYAARHIHLSKRFAIKVLSRKIAEHRQAIERLRQEAVAASSIDHDNIVNVVSFDTTEDGDVFIVMELLKGTSLSDLLGRGPLPLPRSVHITHQICRALHAAHERGIVHRDLKPENVFVVRKSEADFVKVLDFGISKVRTAETEEVRMTKTGQLVGTPLYMSPEQAKGEQDVDRRADIYALGVIMYEMLTGTAPFEGNNYFQLLWKHGNEDPEPPRRRTPDAGISPELEGVVLRALAKAPDDRFSTMAELEGALAAATPEVLLPGGHFLSTPSLTPPSDPGGSAVGPKRSFGTLVAVGALAATMALLGVVWLLTSGEEGEPELTVEPPHHGVASFESAEPGERVEGASAEALPVGADTPGEEPAATLVAVRFLSSPTGATVSVWGEALGTTPLDAPLARSDEPVEVTFSLPGHRDHVVSVEPREGLRVEGRLRPVRRREGASGPSLGIKTEF